MLQSQLGTVKHVLHRIEAKGGARPPITQSYREVPHKRELIEKEVPKMLNNGVIEPSKSPWVAPVVLGSKKDGGWTFCVDYRRLNDMNIKYRYRFPRLDDCIDSLNGAEWFTTLDCNWGYWQIPIANEDCYKTAFTCYCGMHHNKRMPF